MGKSAELPVSSLDNIVYIPAEAEDIPVIYALCKELIDQYEDVSAIAYEKVLDWLKNKITTQIGAYQCVMVNGSKAGYFHLDTDGAETELDDLYVLPQYRGMGIGTKVILHCTALSGGSVFLYVLRKNTDAIRLYSRLGFIITETVGNTRLIMRREG